MFDLGGGEMLLIGIVALVVVGPKELPALFRTVGQFTGKARQMAREFTSAMNSAADQSGMSELNKTLKGVTKPMSYAADRLRETTGLATSSLNNIKPGGATEKLSAEREATKAKIAEAAAKAAEARKAAVEAVKAEETIKAEVQSAVAKAAPKPRKSTVSPDSAAPVAAEPVAKPRKSRAKPKSGETE